MSRRHHHGRTAALAAAVVVGVAVVVAVAWLRPLDRGPGATPIPAPATAVVRRETLSSGVTLTGELGHGDAVPVTDRLPGTYTRLPAVGTLVRAGAPLFEVDGAAVVLFTGGRPFWRSLGPGMSPGEDVRILERNLVDLGFDRGLDLAVDARFTAVTQIAVKRWQKALKLPETGTVELGRVVVLPRPQVRVDVVKVVLGGAATGSDTVFTVTAPQVEATVNLKHSQRSGLRPGARVTVTLASGIPLPGVVRAVDPIRPDGAGGGGSGGGGSGGGGSGGGGGEQPEARATIPLTDQAKAATALASGPSTVTVHVTDRVVTDATVVPVTALTALADGGYAVRVVRPGASVPQLVPVQVGLVANARAEITGSVRPGEHVVVPS